MSYHKPRKIVDCERDCKGIHHWMFVGEDTGGNVYWCHSCGAIGEGESTFQDTKPHRVSVVMRVLED